MAIASLALTLALPAGAQSTALKRDEQIVFFPSLGRRVDGGQAWELEIRGCIYELENRRYLAGSNHATFHYVSASPWQLYPPLAEFVRANGFPGGTFQLKPFRWKGRSLFSLFGDPETYKLAVLEPLLQHSPSRRFILVGDSGERDPEIYAAVARKHPGQVDHIYLRDVTDETAEALRYRRAFGTLPRQLWTVFREPDELVRRQDRKLNAIQPRLVPNM